jgi:3-oxoacyl-[acyl-carrier-protein] synthase II
MDKIFVTGMGIVSSIGKNIEETMNSIRHEHSGIHTLKYLPTSHLELPCGEVDMSNEELKDLLSINKNEIYSRTSLLGIMAAKQAMTQANLIRHDSLRMAFINGTTVGGMDFTEKYYSDYLNNDLHNEYISKHDCGANTDDIVDYFGNLFCYVTTLSTACSSAANAIALGANLLKTNAVDIAVVGGSEALTLFHLNGFNSLMILDHEPCRPFDDTRSGLNLGEGAAFIVLEKQGSASKRKVNLIAELSGYGNACDAFHQTATSHEGIGLQQSMRKALNMAQLAPQNIDYINAHGTGTSNNDLSEGYAIKEVFGDSLPAFSSTKSMTGHTTSASGSIEAVISLLSLQNNIIPASLRFTTPMKELPIKPVHGLIEKDIHHVLSNSCGFGGNCTSLIFSKL